MWVVATTKSVSFAAGVERSTLAAASFGLVFDRQEGSGSVKVKLPSVVQFSSGPEQVCRDSDSKLFAPRRRAEK